MDGVIEQAREEVANAERKLEQTTCTHTSLYTI